jgi:hypothetical protein
MPRRGQHRLGSSRQAGIIRRRNRCDNATLFLIANDGQHLHQLQARDTGGHAGRLCDRLTARFGCDRVFLDIQDIRPGENFARSIEDTIAACDCVIVRYPTGDGAMHDVRLAGRTLTFSTTHVTW